MQRNLTELDVGDRLLLSVTEAAALCGVSRATIFKYLATGELVSVRVGAKGTRIPRDELRRWITARTDAARRVAVRETATR